MSRHLAFARVAGQSIRDRSLSILRATLLAVPPAFSAAATAASPADAQVAYTNPVAGAEQPAADPFILKWNGEYYLYVTGDPITAYHSTDLVTWQPIGPVLSSSDEADAWNQADVWAPEVVYRNGRFYLYYTASRASSDWRIGEMARRVGVAVSDAPGGPFVDIGRPVTPGWAIDGHVFRDPDGGAEYLFYSYLYEPRLPGAGIVLDRMDGGERVTGRPVHVTRGSEAWEDKDGDPRNGSLRYTNEAPTVVKRNGRYYMLYSGGSWDLPTYSLAYAVADTLREDGLDGIGWRKVQPPILRSTPLIEGPGHNTLVKAPNNVVDMVGYHARVVPFRGPGDRQTFVDRLYWHRDRLFMRPPTLGPLPAPEQPLFRDLFNGPDRPFGRGWDVVAGRWRVQGSEAVQDGGGTAVALVAGHALAHYVFEANVRLPGVDSGGGAGVVAYQRGDDRIEVWLDPVRRALLTGGAIDGDSITERATGLDPGFRFDAYHQILVTKNGGRLRVTLDGVEVQERRLELDAGRVGLLARGSRAYFDGVAWTAHFEDGFDAPSANIASPADRWVGTGGAWLVDEGALHQVAGGAERFMALKGDPAVAYEVRASVRWRDQESVRATAGVVAAATGDGATVVAGFDRTIWPFARFHVRYDDGAGTARAFSVPMPRGFLYDEYHTIRVVKQQDAFTFHLDGEEIAAARFPIRAARPGVYTDGVRAAFDDVAVTRLVVPRNLVLDGSFEAERWEPVAGAPAPPWRLSGDATVAPCCAYEGVRRLLITSDDGEARQVVPGLTRGEYTLYAGIVTRGGEAVIRISPEGGEERRVSMAGESWRQVAIDFVVPDGQDAATLSIGAAGLDDAAGEFVAADAIYLVRRTPVL